MCGFSGIFSINSKTLNSDSVIEKMTNAIAHRGPDDCQYFQDEYLNLGFRRLSIIDLAKGQQPMTSNDNKFLICFNGEIYNYKRVRNLLRNKNINLKTNSDTEVLLESFSLWGIKCLEKIDGMFSFVIYDKEKKKIYLSRDRLGIKPLFISTCKDKFLFSSEIKGLLASELIDKEINNQAISSYLTFRYPYGVGTYFKKIESIEPGQILEVSGDGIEKKINYWQIPICSEFSDKGEKFYLKKLEELMHSSVTDHLESDVEIGSLLSGGIDSSLITALMAKKINYKFKSFSASFDKSGYDEVSYAKLVANQLDTEHININLSGSKYIDSLNEVIKVRQTPLSIPHEVALYNLFKEIKNHVKVVFSGEGADELFGGYGRVQTSAFDLNKINFIKKKFPLLNNSFIYGILGANKKFNDWSKIEKNAEFFFNVYNWIPFKEKHLLFSNEFKYEISNDEKIKNFWHEEFKKISMLDSYNQLLFVFQKFHLRCLLDRLDALSMASSVEARVPFVDHRLVEYVMTIPYKYKFKWKSKFHKILGLFSNSFNNSEHRDISKYILRKFSNKYLDKRIVNRKKLGFPVPLDDWSSSKYFNITKEILLDDKTRSRGIFNCKKIEKLLSKKENLNYDFWGKKVWMLMNVELWFREFID